MTEMTLLQRPRRPIRLFVRSGRVLLKLREERDIGEELLSGDGGVTCVSGGC